MNSYGFNRFPMASGLRRVCLCTLTALTLTLYGCGGGGGGGGGTGSTSGPGSGQNSGSGSTASLKASVSSINVTSSTKTEGTALPNPISFSVPVSGNYFYQLSFAGTAIDTGSGVATNGVTSTDYNTGNSAIGPTPALGYTIGATIHGSWSGPQLQINDMYFVSPGILGAGVYHDTLTLHVCPDAACSTEVSGSPVVIPVTYTVTGNTTPAGTITAYANPEVEFPGSQATPANASITINGSSLPPTGAYVTTGASAKGLVTQASFSSPLATYSANVSTGTVSLTLEPPATAGAGIHTDTLPINVCFDTACQKPATGSPWTAHVAYIVDPVAGVDYTQSTIAVATAGIVWSNQTGKLYAIIPGYSTLDPNTLAVIDPYSASIVQAVQLDGGVGQIEPGTLAVSDDGRYLYVAVSDVTLQTDHIERLRTSDLGLDATITFPAFEVIGALAPAPGAPHTLAVETSGNSPELAIYDDGVPRSNTLVGQSGNTLLAFTWGADSSTIYATLGGAAASIDALSVTSTGLQVAKTVSSQALQQVASLGISMQFADGIVCWSSGTTFDPATFALANPFNAQTSTVPSASFAGLLDRAYLITTDQAPGSNPTMTTNIEGFQLSTRSALWILRFPAQNPATQLTRWGGNGLAFFDNNGAGSLVLISGRLVTQ